MSVFSKIRGFFSRHRNKFIVGGIILSGSIVLTHYAQQKLKEWQEREALEFLERSRKQQHFESIARTCNQTVLDLSLALNEIIATTVNTEEIIEALKNNPESKIALWNELKVLIFTKAVCTIYANVMLVVSLKIQLSIIGGYLYKDPNSFSIKLQEKYLSICQNLLGEGFIKLHTLIENICKKTLEPIDLKKQLRLSDIDAIFWSIQTALAAESDNPIDKLRYYILPEISPVDGIYEKALGDTIDLLDSDEVKSIATHCINRNFMLLSQKLSDFYNVNNIKENGKLQDSEEFMNTFNIKKPLAKVLPILNGLFSKKTLTDSFLHELIMYDKLQTLSANIYESLL